MTDRLLVIPRKRRRATRDAKSATTYGLEVVENWITHPPPKHRLFCDFSPAAQAKLDSITSPATYSKGEILFAEDQPPRGIFVISRGRVKLSASASDGKSLIIRMAEIGEMVGLPATISGKRYEVTAEAFQPVEASFIPRKQFREIVRTHGDVALRVAESLADIYHATYLEVRYLGLSGSAEAKLARYLLDLPEDQNHDHGRALAKSTPTHEQIAEMVGTSRETVTRLLAEFKRKRLVDIHGSRLLIANKSGLRKLLA
jgi:CRP/FNR family cyclic AMP-dependent transcriptional regulator